MSRKEKRRETQHSGTTSCPEAQKHEDRTTYWVREGAELPPPGHFQDNPKMTPYDSLDRRSNSSYEAGSSSCGEEDNTNTYDSMDEAERNEELCEDLRRWREENNIHYLYNGSMDKKNRKLCEDLMKDNQTPNFPLYDEF